MTAELPYCAVCRIKITPADDVVFSRDGGVRHTDCPTIVCPMCSLPILPQQPIRSDRDVLIHADCWMSRRGVSAPSERDRTESVRARLESGALPAMDPTKVWGNTSSGGTCGGCTEKVEPGQIEYELQFANTLSFRLHRGCYLIWRQQREGVRRAIGGGSGASPWTAIFERRLTGPVSIDPEALHELLLAAAETRLAASELRRFSRSVRARTAALCSMSRDTRTIPSAAQR